MQLIGATTTCTGLKVQCAIHHARYPADVKVSDAEMADLKLTPHAFHGGLELHLSSSNVISGPFLASVCLHPRAGELPC